MGDAAFGAGRWLCVMGDMELLRGDGSPPRFPCKQFVAQRRKYDANVTTEWASPASLRAAARALCPGGRGALLGHIGQRAARDWLGWQWGMLYTVGYGGGVLFCMPRGAVVAGWAARARRAPRALVVSSHDCRYAIV